MSCFQWPLACVAFLVGCGLSAQTAAVAAKHKVTFEEALQASRSALVIDQGRLSGEGAAVLARAVEPARFVLLGEDHITQEIPLFAGALCDLVHPDAYAVEAGPYAAAFVDGLLGKPERVAAMAARNRVTPNSMAFLDVRAENDLAQHCAASSHNANFHLWGLDQEFLGAGVTLLQAMQATHPGPVAAAAIAAAQLRAQADDAGALRSGNILESYLLTATDAELAALQRAVTLDGTPATQGVLQEFVASREIYKRDDHTQNDLRVALMKRHFFERYGALKKVNPQARVMFKFGDVHVQKGLNSLHERDLGNMAAELADAEHTQSVSLFVFGAKGTHATFGGFGKPMGHVPFVADEEDKWITPVLANLLPQAGSGTTYTVFDLRSLRFRRLALPETWEHVVYAYDLLIVMPESTPADYLHE